MKDLSSICALGSTYEFGEMIIGREKSKDLFLAVQMYEMSKEVGISRDRLKYMEEDGKLSDVSREGFFFHEPTQEDGFW